MIALAAGMTPAGVAGLVAACCFLTAAVTWVVKEWRDQNRLDEAWEVDTTEAMANADDRPAEATPAVLYDQDAGAPYCCQVCPSTDTTLTAAGVPTCREHEAELVG